MALRKPLASHIDYSQYFPEDIQASNLDFIMEMDGKFLVIEFKQGTEILTIGQSILLEHLAKTKGFTVLVVNASSWTADMWRPEGIFENYLVSHEDIINFIRRWRRINYLNKTNRYKHQKP